ncbi:MAG: hypothetical protein COX19_17670 [Desulfobacterales bacterium CG23_combo_of_CG06-09_8_20_14_all_51_8]|nr:MAG: hypothetical protein COX19_17670 [Desulfobacterales bacterium CG23_combo_of_CG06-09_8_20_14_all_51_8]
MSWRAGNRDGFRATAGPALRFGDRRNNFYFPVCSATGAGWLFYWLFGTPAGRSSIDDGHYAGQV